jgi:hypothetical protein
VHSKCGLRRATSPKEERFREAIEAEMKAIGGTVPSQHPYKDAEAIRIPGEQAEIGTRRRECGRNCWAAWRAPQKDLSAAVLFKTPEESPPRSSRTRKTLVPEAGKGVATT